MFLLTFLNLSIRVRICIRYTDSAPATHQNIHPFTQIRFCGSGSATLLLCTVNKNFTLFSGMYACATIPFLIFSFTPSFYCISPSKSSQTEPALHLVCYTVSHHLIFVLSFLSFYDVSVIPSLLYKCLNRVQ